jgi:hypothetical protein
MLRYLPFFVVVLACDRAPAERHAARPAPTPKRAEQPPPRESVQRYPMPERLVAIGDVHGDLGATRAALRLAGAIDDSDQWIGGKLVVVQTGDQLDRGDEERPILDLMHDLEDQARRAGGAVHSLNGNHEVMNVQGDFRYVTRVGLEQFDSVSERSPLAARAPEGMRGRAGAFLPGGHYARMLAERVVIAVVGNTVFAHGGVLREHVDYGIARLNREVSAWMRGDGIGVPEPVVSEDGPVWTRAYGGEESESACGSAKQVLKALGVERMVVGHTVQKAGISSICEGAVWRIDVGLAAHYGARPIQVLEITKEGTQALSAERER